MQNRWYKLENKDGWTLINTIEFIKTLHGVFEGSYMAERSIAWIREIIEVALDQRQDQLNHRESLEISKMLQWEPIKSMEKVLVQFDVASKPILVKFDPKESGTSSQ